MRPLARVYAYAYCTRVFHHRPPLGRKGTKGRYSRRLLLLLYESERALPTAIKYSSSIMPLLQSPPPRAMAGIEKMDVAAVAPPPPAAAPAVAALVSDPGDPTPCKAEELYPAAELPRLVFRQVPGHRHDETWQERNVRPAPVTAAPSAKLGYFNNSKTASNSNVLQVILRDHGYERMEAIEEAWSIFWCAGQMDPPELCKFLPHQRINKFPKATILTMKANLWTNVKAMQTKHGIQHFGFMPTTFVLPRELKAFERHLKDQLATSAPAAAGGSAACGDASSASVDPLWIFKPAAAYCGRGIWVHRVERSPSSSSGAENGGNAPLGGKDKDSPLTDDMHEHKGVVSQYIDPVRTCTRLLLSSAPLIRLSPHARSSLLLLLSPAATPACSDSRLLPIPPSPSSSTASSPTSASTSSSRASIP